MSTIEWTDETWNPTVGCSKVSPGCDNCYAIGVAHRAMQPAHEGLTIRRPGEATDWTGEVRQLPDRLDTPLRWRKPRRVFVDSMSDLFHPDVPDEFIGAVYHVMEQAQQHTFQVLTKRPQRMATWVNDRLGGYARKFDDCPTEAMRNSPAAEWARHRAEHGAPNVWLGTSIESDRYTFRADHLRATPAAVRFLSLEPLLGPLPSLNLDGIDWVIVGGESGHDARPMHPDWASHIRRRCHDEGVAFFFKQWGDWGPLPTPTNRSTAAVAYDGCDHRSPLGDDPAYVRWAHEHDHIRPNRLHAMYRVGKKAAGRELDGRTWDEMPTTAGATT